MNSMNRVTSHRLAVVAFAAAFAVSACASTSASPTPAATPAATLVPSDGWPLAAGKKVCHIISLTNAYSSAVVTIATKEAKLLGLQWDVKDSKDVTDATQAIALVDSCITAQYDAIAIVTYDPTALNATFKKAFDAGIPVIQEGQQSDAEGMTWSATYIGSSGEAEGKLAGEAICGVFGTEPGGWGLIGFPEGISITDGRGMARDVVASQCPNATLVAEQFGNVNREQGRTVMEGFLQAHRDDLQLVYCMNDDLCMGAAKAITDAGLTDQIKVLGIDFNQETADAIRAGTFWGSILNDASWIGVGIVQRARDAIEHRPVLKEYISPATLITKENLDQFVPWW